MNAKPSAVTNLNKRTERYISISAIVAVLSTLLVISGLYFSFQKLKTYYTLKTETQSITNSQQSTQELLTYVNQHIQDIERIDMVFPDESNIDLAYQSILAVSQQIDIASTLSFNALVPTKHNNQSILPMTLKLRAPHFDVIGLLKQLERLPYIIEIVSLEMTNPASQNGQVDIKFRLYVDEKFTQS